MTPKDSLYKLRQVEFRALNKRTLRPDQVTKDEKGRLCLIVPETIVHKEKYTGLKGK